MQERQHPNFDIGQRVKVKERGDGSTGPPIELRGKKGTVEGMAGMVSRGDSIPQQWVHRYVVVIDNSADPTTLIPGDWLELLEA